ARAGHLLPAGAGYWMARVVVPLATAMPILRRVTRADAHGSASVSVDQSGFHASVLDGTTAVWQVNFSILTMVLWAAIPPLLLWGLWLLAQSRRDKPHGSLAEGEAERIVGRERDQANAG